MSSRSWKSFVVALVLVCAAMPGMSAAQRVEPEASSVKGQAEDARQAIYKMQQELIQLLRQRPNDPAATQQAQAMENEIAARSKQLEALLEHAAAAKAEEVERRREVELDRLRVLLTERDSEVAKLHDRLSEMEKQREAPVENAVLKVFSLRNLSAARAADLVSSIIGQVRVAADDRANALVASGAAETLDTVEALLQKLDSAAYDSEEREATPRGDAPRSLRIRVFWLADGVPQDVGESPDEYLPEAVIKAMQELGLRQPRLVAQTMNSLSRDGNRGNPAMFSTQAPALLQQPAVLNCTGQVRPIRDGQAELEVKISVGGRAINMELEGSITAPLGHYMVLGTANAVSSDSVAADAPNGRGEDARGRNGGRGYGRGGVGGGRGVDSQSESAQPEGDAAPAATYHTSRFAFVVQVVEAKSFAPKQ